MEQKNAIAMAAETEKGPILRVGSGAGGGAADRLKRHRLEVAGRVWIPETWGQEESLKEWIDCTTFDKALSNSRIMSARAALISDNHPRLRITTNTC